MKKQKQQVGQPMDGGGKIFFFPAWCKRCGNCVAFCPRKALEQDQWGSPYLARPDRCTTCGMCEMLCPDFAISVGGDQGEERTAPCKPARPGEKPALHQSPERLANVDSGEDGNA